MANLPEKNVVLVDKITNVPTDSNLFINANGEFKQASVNDVVNSSTVVSTAVETAINTAVQDSIDSNFKQTSGSPILLTDSADGTLIDFKAYGRSTQKQYSGKNLLAPTLATATSNGITCTNNGDGTYTLNGTSTDVTYFNLAANYQLNAGTYKFVGVPSAINGLKIYQGSIPNTPVDSGNGVTFSLDSDISNYKPFIEVLSGKTLSNVIIKPMLTTDLEATYDTYEPYVGGTASPSQDYPQAIKSVADSGYFDGELLQGYYQAATGNFVSSVSYISNKNKIPCKGNDEVKLLYKEVVAELGIYFWDKDGSNIGKKILTSVNEVSATAPTNATYFTFWVNKSGIEPSNAKKIVVTINGKYALIVKSKGKNLWEFGDQEFTTQKMVYVNLPAGTYTCSANITSSGTDYTAKSTFMFYAVDCTTLIGQFALDRNVRNGASATIPQKIGAIKMYAETNYSNSVNDTAIFKDIQLEFGNTMTDYEPYKEEVKYIPLNEPLRSSLDGSVTDEVSATKVTRRFAEVVFDGSDDEVWVYNNQYFYNTGITTAKAKDNAICTHYTFANINTSILTNDNVFGIRTFGICFNNTSITSLDEWKTLLQANPITVIYELAEPIIETIEPVDIATYDNVAYLTASDNAEMEIEYPTTKVAGIASIGYSKGRKAEYETEQLKKQLLEIQATIVNTL